MHPAFAMRNSVVGATSGTLRSCGRGRRQNADSAHVSFDTNVPEEEAGPGFASSVMASRGGARCFLRKLTHELSSSNALKMPLSHLGCAFFKA